MIKKNYRKNLVRALFVFFIGCITFSCFIKQVNYSVEDSFKIKLDSFTSLRVSLEPRHKDRVHVTMENNKANGSIKELRVALYWKESDSLQYVSSKEGVMIFKGEHLKEKAGKNKFLLMDVYMKYESPGGNLIHKEKITWKKNVRYQYTPH